VTFDGLFTGDDNRFESKWFASCVLSRVGFSYRKLSDGPSKKIKSHLSLVELEGVGEFGFAGFQF
jgi:hypothetical protein